METSIELSSEDEIFENFKTGNAVFIKYWHSDYTDLYYASPLPSGKNGITGTVVSTYNIAISKYSNQSKRKSAAKVLEYLTSKTYQKKAINDYNIYSSIDTLYDDDDICEVIECEIFKSIIPYSVVNYNNIVDDNYFEISDYISMYEEYIFQYVIGNITLNEAIRKIEDITKFYYFSFDTENTYIGILFFIIYIVLTLLMLSSLVFLFIKKFEKHFNLLSKDLWILTVFGSIITNSSIIGKYGETESFKCHVEHALINLGYVISLTPVLYILLINFPEPNKLTRWIYNHKYQFHIIIIFTKIIIASLLFFTTYKVDYIYVEDGRNFKKCYSNGFYGILTSILIDVYQIFIIFSILFLIFIEWNLKELFIDIRFFLSAMVMNIISIIIYNIFSSMKIDDFFAYNLIVTLNVMIISFFNYLFIYGIRILYIFIKKDEEEDQITKEIRERKSSISPNKNNLNSTTIPKNASFFYRIMIYHNREQINRQKI